jgi:hypothetical protein
MKRNNFWSKIRNFDPPKATSAKSYLNGLAILPTRRHFIPGVDVMITIFSDFFPIFCGKKMAFFSKTKCYDQSFSKSSSCLHKKMPIFSPIFDEKKLKIITSVPASWYLPAYAFPNFCLRALIIHLNRRFREKILVYNYMRILYAMACFF